VVALFAAAGLVILVAAEPFAGALVEGGKVLGIDEFLLVQWLAPLASESPELLVAAVLALRGPRRCRLGHPPLLEGEQWTLLVGSLPLAFLVGGGPAAGIALDARQTEEFILTSAQTVLGFAVLIDLRLAIWESVALLILFAAQFPFPQTGVRLGFSVAYAAMAIALIFRGRRELPRIARAAREAYRGFFLQALLDLVQLPASGLPRRHLPLERPAPCRGGGGQAGPPMPKERGRP